MTLQCLSKYLDKYDSQVVDINSNLESLKGLPFYNFQNHADKNAFNHIVGLPRKGGLDHILYDCERLLFNTLEANKHS